MKKAIALLLFMLMLLSLVGCHSNNLKKPETNLEFWIGENVDDVDFSEYQPKFGLMDGREYYGKGYIPTTGENREQIDPKECVIYTITKYPDYASKNSHITRIFITDPNVNIYGLTINSSASDIEETMKNNGFKSVEIGNLGNTEWVKGKYHIKISEECICISVDVSNLGNIQF